MPIKRSPFPPIRILHVIDKLSMDGVNPSSCANLISGWITHFDANRFNASVCTLRNPDPGGGFLEKNGIRVYYLGFSKFSPKNIKAIMNLIERDKADIVHLHGYAASNFGRIAARAKHTINVIHEHAVLRILPHQYLADLLLRNHTDAAIAVSFNVKDFMIRGRCIPALKIAVIPNGINLDKFTKVNQPTIKMKRYELGIPENFRVVGTITRLREEKGNEYFIRGMPYVLKEFPDVFFIIVGDGPLRGPLERLTIKLKLSSHVRFMGFRTDIAELLSVFDINVIPSLSEGFPLSLAEAMSVGNAIIATSVGGSKEIGVDGKNILLVQPKNPIALADNIRFLLRNPSFTFKLSEEAKKASKKFSVTTNVNLLSKFYRKLLFDCTKRSFSLSA